MLNGSDDSCAVERRDSLAESFTEKWMADRSASFHMTHSADRLSDVRLRNDNVRIPTDRRYGLRHAYCKIFRRYDSLTIGCGLRAGFGV